ncbi:hypothetical protein LshimejAT787_0905960 [Lyophyllum shimeji]|uniref:Uncharacterized protein n=1 Tax=Lyophyllum shimeji TaxID=47721 RepID=A0A9P3USN6_LYOSH|nr:hypothetical protein LshimejAT787_0905960 [Lyophyllum shimeji]
MIRSGSLLRERRRPSTDYTLAPSTRREQPGRLFAEGRSREAWQWYGIAVIGSSGRPSDFDSGCSKIRVATRCIGHRTPQEECSACLALQRRTGRHTRSRPPSIRQHGV